MSNTYAFLTLFIAAFLAATLFPAQSELVLGGLITNTSINPIALIAIASLGNILGSCLNYLIGRFIETLKHNKHFPINERSLSNAQKLYAQYGRLSLLLSWVPVIGDPITIVSGIMREKFWVFLVLVGIAKTGRYIALYYALMGVMG